MNLRKATMFAGAAQLLALLGSSVNYIKLLGQLRWGDNVNFFIMQTIWLMAQATLVLFFFVLAGELKRD